MATTIHIMKGSPPKAEHVPATALCDAQVQNRGHMIDPAKQAGWYTDMKTDRYGEQRWNKLCPACQVKHENT